MLSVVNKMLIVLFLLCTASVVCATPVMAFYDAAFATDDFNYRDSMRTAPESFRAKKAPDFNPPDIQFDFLKPPAFNTANSNLSLKSPNSLPAVPAAIFMTFVGFLCVTWVKDRKAWRAFLVSLLWLGQAGITAVPQLAMAICQRKHHNNYAITKHEQLDVCVHDDRVRLDVDGAKYIGLLHHLEGIPITNNFPSLSVGNIPIQTVNSSEQFAVQGLRAYLDKANDCTFAKTVQHISFYPAFIFEKLARGPPFQS